MRSATSAPITAAEAKHEDDRLPPGKAANPMAVVNAISYCQASYQATSCQEPE